MDRDSPKNIEVKDSRSQWRDMLLYYLGIATAMEGGGVGRKIKVDDQ